MCLIVRHPLSLHSELTFWMMSKTMHYQTVKLKKICQLPRRIPMGSHLPGQKNIDEEWRRVKNAISESGLHDEYVNKIWRMNMKGVADDRTCTEYNQKQKNQFGGAAAVNTMRKIVRITCPMPACVCTFNLFHYVKRASPFFCHRLACEKVCGWVVYMLNMR